jgi:hypothetical protein
VNWHNDLLLQMQNPVNGIRDNFISEDLAVYLKEYLRFRHLFRHIYGFELKWERIKQLCIGLDAVFSSLKKEMIRFFAELEE